MILKRWSVWQSDRVEGETVLFFRQIPRCGEAEVHMANLSLPFDPEVIWFNVIQLRSRNSFHFQIVLATQPKAFYPKSLQDSSFFCIP